MIYGHNKTIHGTQQLNVEVDKKGNVVSVWFRCCALPFDVTVVGKERASEMGRMYEETVNGVKLNAVDVDYPDRVKHETPTDKDENWEVCDHCHLAKPDVHERQNPYDADVNNDPESMHTSCDNCNSEIAGDI